MQAVRALEAADVVFLVTRRLSRTSSWACAGRSWTATRPAHRPSSRSATCRGARGDRGRAARRRRALTRRPGRAVPRATRGGDRSGGARGVPGVGRSDALREHAISRFDAGRRPGLAAGRAPRVVVISRLIGDCGQQVRSVMALLQLCRGATLLHDCRSP
ncbi:MAG: hypothetical protein M3P50_03980 [Actinomycetota bacterium]|nr:hypothetical protein [Actinomycetota bacterium]